MKVRAAFLCKTITQWVGPAGGMSTMITLEAFGGVTNESWSKGTPNGVLTMTITNPDAIDAFALGKGYYLDFTPAE